MTVVVLSATYDFKMRYVLWVFGLLAVPTFDAAGQTIRTFVSASGVDSASCSRADPCRTFRVALAAVDVKGEVVALDSVGYGPFTIDKAVSIIAPSGVHAAIAATMGNAIEIAAGAQDVVTLRGLHLTSLGANRGIHVGLLRTLYVESVDATGFVGQGLLFSSSGWLFVKDSNFKSNYQGALLGGGGNWAPSATITSSSFVDSSSQGLLIQAGATVSVGRCTFSNNANSGIETIFANLVLDGSVVTQNLTGIVASGAGNVAIRDSTVSQNGGQVSGYGIIAGDDVRMTINDCAVDDNGPSGAGVYVWGNAQVSAERTSVSGSLVGFRVSEATSGGARLNISDCVATRNNYGVLASGSLATVRVTSSSAVDNTDNGFRQNASAVFESLGNNLVRGNGVADISGTVVVVSPQ